METLNATIFSMWNLLKETNTDVTVAKTVIVAITTLVLAVVVKKVANFCVWYIYYIKLMRQVPGPENTHWLYGNLHLV